MKISKIVLCSSILLSSCTVSANILSPVYDFIKNYHLDTITACLAPAALVYHIYSQETVKDVREKAQSLLAGYYNNARVYTVNEVNNALWAVKATDEEIKTYLKREKWFFTGFTSFFVGGLYAAIRYSDPVSPSGSGVVYHRCHCGHSPFFAEMMAYLLIAKAAPYCRY